ncbi:hypothetical protein HSBAA_29240 [Vreelandella sulfidaeris]|uniref:Uncharacterized protein n=1 Tax=Vreelandella sulfidaeris TaxID=115553 RepID=A0A455UBD5_9GAMM|nr:hypothetical protein HSBAA_29240 [Halomonas sulfidaeris]
MANPKIKREAGKYWVKDQGRWITSKWDGHCWEDDDHFGFNDSDYEEIGEQLINPDGKPG